MNIFGKFEANANKVIFVGYAITRAYRVYNLRLNFVMEFVHVEFDDKRIQGFEDEGNHDALKFENEVFGEINDSDDEEIMSKANSQKILYQLILNSSMV